jgi:hypothetical protein
MVVFNERFHGRGVVRVVIKSLDAESVHPFDPFGGNIADRRAFPGRGFFGSRWHTLKVSFPKI